MEVVVRTKNCTPHFANCTSTSVCRLVWQNARHSEEKGSWVLSFVLCWINHLCLGYVTNQRSSWYSQEMLHSEKVSLPWSANSTITKNAAMLKNLQTVPVEVQTWLPQR